MRRFGGLAFGAGGGGGAPNHRIRGEVHYAYSIMPVILGTEALASLQCRDGARRVVFTDQAGIAFTKREAPWGVRRVA